VAAALGLCLLGLAGLPPTAGFVGRFGLFAAAVDARFAWLALIGLAASVVSLAYYVRVMMVITMHEPADAFEVDFDPWGVRMTLILTSAGVCLLGVAPGGVLELAFDSVRPLFGVGLS
jgi:NADH-quinone oxidoreductase subunit N